MMDKPFEIPWDPETEDAFLGSLLTGTIPAELVDIALQTVQLEDMSSEDHRLLLRAIADVHAAGEAPDPISVKEAFRRRGGVLRRGALELRDLAAAAPIPANVLTYGRRIAEDGRRRRTARTLHELQVRLASGEATSDVLSAIRHAGEEDLGTSRSGTQLLVVRDFIDVMDALAAAGPARWLIEGLWPADAYGVIGAEDKAGKTWAALDLAVSVATGTPWLGRFPCLGPARVLLFLGEGGERATLRRFDAIIRGRGGMTSDLFEESMVRLCFCVPRLTSGPHLTEVAAELEANPPGLVLLDPLYLAAPAGRGADLYAMGEALYAIQSLCQEAGAALVITTHWNKTGEGRGAKRFTGVGPSAWGRVLGSAAVERRTTDPGGASNVLLRWEFIGGEIADAGFRMRRRVWAGDPESLDSYLHYEVEVLELAPPPVGAEDANFRPTGYMEKVSLFLEATSEPASLNRIRSGVRGGNRWIDAAVEALRRERFISEFEGPHGARMQRLERPFREETDARDEDD